MVWFGMPCLKTVLQISWLRRVFKTVVLSTIKGTNGVKKFMKILSMNVKNHLKNPKLRKNLT